MLSTFSKGMDRWIDGGTNERRNERVRECASENKNNLFQLRFGQHSVLVRTPESINMHMDRNGMCYLFYYTEYDNSFQHLLLFTTQIHVKYIIYTT